VFEKWLVSVLVNVGGRWWSVFGVCVGQCRWWYIFDARLVVGVGVGVGQCRWWSVFGVWLAVGALRVSARGSMFISCTAFFMCLAASTSPGKGLNVQFMYGLFHVSGGLFESRQEARCSIHVRPFSCVWRPLRVPARGSMFNSCTALYTCLAASTSPGKGLDVEFMHVSFHVSGDLYKSRQQWACSP
jgi:hypothetical protein